MTENNNRKEKKKNGRPRVMDAQIRENIVHVRLDAVEYLRLEELKMRSKKSASAVIRELIAGGSVRERMRRAHLDLMAQLKGVARNLNQLTRLANAVGFGASIVPKLQPRKMGDDLLAHLSAVVLHEYVPVGLSRRGVDAHLRSQKPGGVYAIHQSR